MMSPTVPVVRFAPSPNGYLHLGHAFSALLNDSFAKAHKGRFLLRIEDIDTGRSRPEFIEAIYEDLDWLGVQWEEPVRQQSRCFADYQQALKSLQKRGLLYGCSASRKEIHAFIEALPNAENYPRDPTGGLLYPGIYKEKGVKADQEQGLSLRLDMTKAIAELGEQQLLPLKKSIFQGDVKEKHFERIEAEVYPEQWGDIILARKDVPTSYHLSVVVDDALQGVTHVIRGKDLEQATSIHRVLQVLLRLEAPLYYHHDLIKTDKGRKLSKSASDISLRALRKSGWTADDVKEYFQQ